MTTLERVVARSLLCLAATLLPLGSDGRETEILDLSIKGTKLLYNAMGMPSSAEGIVYFRGGPRSGEVAGSYVETLTPVMDPELGLAGTAGVSVFKFSRRQGEEEVVDEFTTHNDSTIVGEIPVRGILLVESTGRVESGSGRFAAANGRLYTSSRVKLGAAFLMDVRLRIVFEVNDDSAEPGETFAHGCRECVSNYHAQSVRNAWGGGGATLQVAIGADGNAEVRYSARFKRDILRQMLSSEAPESPAAISARTGVSQSLLERWRGEGKMLRALAGMMKGAKAAPAIAQRSFEEKLGVVLKAAFFRGTELDNFLGREGVKKADLKDWQVAIEAAIAKGSNQEKPSPSGESNALESLKKRFETILEEGQDQKDSGD